MCLVSCVLCLVSCVLCLVSCVLCLVSCVLCLVSCVLCRVSCVLCRVSCVLPCALSGVLFSNCSMCALNCLFSRWILAALIFTCPALLAVSMVIFNTQYTSVLVGWHDACRCHKMSLDIRPGWRHCSQARGLMEYQTDCVDKSCQSQGRESSVTKYITSLGSRYNVWDTS